MDSPIVPVRTRRSECPPLPKTSFIRRYTLSKVGAHGTGWGLVLRGTSCELEGNLKVYTCLVENVTEGGEAQAQGIEKGDQIVSIDDIQVRDLDHSRVVRFFQLKDTLKLTILPSHVLTLGQQIRITQHNSSSVHSIWGLMNNLHSLEIIGINLNKCGVFLGTLINLKCLSLCHCSLSSLTPIRGLQMLKRLTSLSLAHNYLSDDVLTLKNCNIQYLTNLKKVDLSRNLLSVIPDVLYKLSRLEILVLVDNNLSTIPDTLGTLESLHTLCLDGNLINDVDDITRLLPALCKLSVSDNRLECEPEVIKLGHYLITGVEKNPYKRSAGGRDDSRREPSLRRTLSVRGHVKKYPAKFKDDFN